MCHHFLYGSSQLISFTYSCCLNVVTCCYFNKVWVTHYCGSIPTFEKQFLPLSHHTEMLVIEHHDFYSSLILENSSQFLNGHLVTSVSNDSHYFSIWSTHFCTNSCRKSKAHSA